MNSDLLNKSGNRRGMSLVSRSNLKPNGNPNGRPKDYITPFLKLELTRVPTLAEDGFDGKGKTNAWWIARRAVRDARNGDKSARAEVLERTEGKIALPLAGEKGNPIEILVKWDGNRNETNHPPASPPS